MAPRVLLFNSSSVNVMPAQLSLLSMSSLKHCLNEENNCAGWAGWQNKRIVMKRVRS